MNVFRPCSRTGAARRAVRTRVRPALVALAAMVLVLGGARVAVAQYFGRNHVRYHAFHYRVLTTPHFEIC
ncbi:MAG TPA: hypothetical protein VND92_04785, partial [Vicinamibacterales bacterium]|nr:hypothetical protein [Vicinamibacterales bacterium]